MAMRGAELPFSCGFSEARKLRIVPRKGTRSVRILRPQLHSREEEAPGGEQVLHSWMPATGARTAPTTATSSASMPPSPLAVGRQPTAATALAHVRMGP